MFMPWVDDVLLYLIAFLRGGHYITRTYAANLRDFVEYDVQAGGGKGYVDRYEDLRVYERCYSWFGYKTYCIEGLIAYVFYYGEMPQIEWGTKREYGERRALYLDSYFKLYGRLTPQERRWLQKKNNLYPHMSYSQEED